MITHFACVKFIQFGGRRRSESRGLAVPELVGMHPNIIRDLNNDLLKHPFDEDLKQLLRSYRARFLKYRNKLFTLVFQGVLAEAAYCANRNRLLLGGREVDASNTEAATPGLNREKGVGHLVSLAEVL
jgi:hypothetical protein